MSITLTGVITGAAVTGLTSPTFTLTPDTSADDNARQSAVTALGGTQTGSTVHSVSSPFLVKWTRPRTLRTLGRPNLNGLISNVGRNSYRQTVTKGTLPLAGQPSQNSIIRTDYEVVAGAETADLPNLRSMVSFNSGLTWANATGIVDTLNNAIL